PSTALLRAGPPASAFWRPSSRCGAQPSARGAHHRRGGGRRSLARADIVPGTLCSFEPCGPGPSIVFVGQALRSGLVVLLPGGDRRKNSRGRSATPGAVDRDRMLAAAAPRRRLDGTEAAESRFRLVCARRSAV